ncbi:MAG: hypothetical protein JSS96_02220 [Bacteroidetes bacterium]|nr:hypothetical protein [Bacteroidota bacterium]
MKLLPFNSETRKRLMQKGYQHIEIKYMIDAEFSWLADDKKLQILKAVDSNDTAQPDKLEYINSESIDALLHNEAVNSFIIVNAIDDL